ncbi:putative methyltransferase DDB_G0268948 [Dendropsophus ebraccatus]|uniref:putative methyltransferase DDB_G0268948 n=1 Tax=Dendropsophus ebraccatus TaxID=150705 RepID=UPI003831669B
MQKDANSFHRILDTFQDFYIRTTKAKVHIIMAVHLFKKRTYSSVYQKYMVPVSSEILNIIVSFVKEKTDGRPLKMGLDVGCGTGRYTLPLAPHFEKVLGVDISESQINVAKQHTTANNVSYMVAPAEKLPMKDTSVDLVNAALAAHWFTTDEFFDETIRVLKTRGCLAVHGFSPNFDIEYKDLSHDLNVVLSEALDTLSQYYDSIVEHMLCQYRSIYEAIPLKDKEWITDIPVRIQMSVPEIVGLFQSFYMYQTFMEKDVKGAEEFLIQTKERFQDILGEEADSVQLNINMKYYCVLACKH